LNQSVWINSTGTKRLDLGYSQTGKVAGS